MTCAWMESARHVDMPTQGGSLETGSKGKQNAQERNLVSSHIPKERWKQSSWLAL